MGWYNDSYYLSPAKGAIDFATYLNILSEVAHRYVRDPLLICDDFIAHCLTWDIGATNKRRDLVQD